MTITCVAYSEESNLILRYKNGFEGYRQTFKDFVLIFIYLLLIYLLLTLFSNIFN